MKYNELQTPYTSGTILAYAKNGNDLITRKKPLRQIEDRLYHDKPAKNGTISRYVFYPEVGVYLKLDNIDSTAEIRVGKMLTLQELTAILDDIAAANGYIQKIYIELLKDYAPQKAQTYTESCRAYLQAQEQREQEEKEQKRKEREQKRKAQEQQTEQIIQAALAAFKHSGTVENKTITIYTDDYNYKECKLITYLAALYGVKVPLKTQGAINNNIASIIIENSEIRRVMVKKQLTQNTWRYLFALNNAIQAN